MKRIFTFLFFIILFVSRLFAQNISNEGTDFWVCFASHVPATGGGGGLASLSVFITSKDNTSGVVSCGSFSQVFNVTANTVTEVVVPRSNSYINNGTGISPNKGIRVLIDPGKPKAVVYAHVFAGARSAATLVLPVLALGQKYYAIAYDQSQTVQGAKSQFNIVCVEPNTKLNITPRLNGVVQPQISVTLTNVGDVYEYQNDKDISGTYIEVDGSTSSCKRFAAFSGSSALGILSPGCNPPGGATELSVSYDPLFQQLYPLESWGTKFPLIPFYNRNTGAIFRILAQQDNTTVTINGTTATINAGQFYQTTPITDVSLITSDKPVSVTEYALTQYCSDSRNRGAATSPSDPDMVILNPLEYSIKNVTMYSSTKLAITDQYVNVMIPNGGVASFKINGTLYANRFSSVPGNPDYSYAQIDLKQVPGGGTNFNLTSDVGFNAMAYGFGNFESYAYSAGTNLASSVFINAVRPATDEIIQNACRDEKFDFRLVLPYISTKLIWTLETGDAPIEQDNPTYTQITINGKVLFEYRLPVDKVYTTVGTKKITIVSTIPPTAGGCPSGDETLNFDFEVYDPPPTTSFSPVSKACVNTPVQFNIVDPNNTGRPITNYFWDFGDGLISQDKNPVYTFSSTGTKNVSLYVKSDVDCVSNVVTFPTEVYAQPSADFSSDQISCAQKPVQFTDQSNLAGNTVSSYLWDFGDGSTATEQNPVHVYQQGGNYNVTFSFKTEAGCQTSITKTKVINNAPQIDFADPEACVLDVANFMSSNQTKDVASYSWDFGDGTINNQQDVKANPTHQYQAAGLYNVKLKVVSNNGCTTELTKSVTISGASPQAKFSVLNENNLCSNQPVQFQDLSSISFGNITKLVWIYDYSPSGTNDTVQINNPKPQDIYTHKYPSNKITLNYQVVLRAYSGQICYQDYGPITVTVKGSPEVKFDPIPDACLNAAPFKITTASEVTGIPGNGTFSGVGVSADGYFNPSISGVGTFEITYSFTAANGCNDTKSQNINVYPVPVTNAGEDKVILTGGQTQLKATAGGTELTYKWIPSTGLNRDDILNPIASPKTTTTYTLIVTSSKGCTESDQVDVIVTGYPKIPDTFTPNNDGVNDTWNIKYLNTYVNAKVTIFNRYGNTVFSSKGYDIPWDGKTEGKDVPVGVYYYLIDPGNGGKSLSGSVTVIR